MSFDALKITNLKKTYTRKEKHTEALKGVSLDIRQGEIFGLLGPNGAGKSTLINILSGTVRPSAGSVMIMGRNLFAEPLDAKRFLGIVPQEVTMDIFFSPYESLELMAGYYGVPPKERQTEELLEIFDLTAKAHVSPRSLSGGMKRRLLIAKALVHSPAVLILDEPTAGVDIRLRKSILDYVFKLNRERGTTVILTTHYLEEAQILCDRLAFINKGQIVLEGLKEKLLQRLDRKVLKLTTALEALPPIFGEESALQAVLDKEQKILSIAYAPSRTTISQLLDLLCKNHIIFTDITTEESSLDDLFLALTN